MSGDIIDFKTKLAEQEQQEAIAANDRVIDLVRLLTDSSLATEDVVSLYGISIHPEQHEEYGL